MERVRRVWWLAFLLPGMTAADGNLGPAVASFVAVVAIMGFFVWLDWRDARNAAGFAARQADGI
jgi:hypothetical protein